jgi:mono/diheme cytochrome c family protein
MARRRLVATISQCARVVTQEPDGGFEMHYLKGREQMENLKNLILASSVMTLVILVLVISSAARGKASQADPAAFYASKCVTCHGKKAEKKFDASLTDDQLVEIVLKGKKPAKPPNMPAYGEKGVTADQAKALVAYMKQLKTP